MIASDMNIEVPDTSCAHYKWLTIKRKGQLTSPCHGHSIHHIPQKLMPNIKVIIIIIIIIIIIYFSMHCTDNVYGTLVTLGNFAHVICYCI